MFLKMDSKEGPPLPMAVDMKLEAIGEIRSTLHPGQKN